MADPALELVAAKLRVPRPHRQLLPRPRLEALSRSYPVVLLVADAGFGKTSLLYQRTLGTAGTMWYSMDERDRDPVTFAQHLLATAQSTLALSAEDWPSIARLAPESFAEWLVGRLFTLIGKFQSPALLVLDD